MDTSSSSYAAIAAAYASRKDKTDEEIFSFLERLKGNDPASKNNKQTATQVAVEPTTQKPAVDPEESVTKDKIFCLECGQGFAMIRRHLNAAHDLTPEAYRAKWGLDPSYPMTSAKFSKKKQFTAKQIGFGTYDRSGTKKKKKSAAEA